MNKPKRNLTLQLSTKEFIRIMLPNGEHVDLHFYRYNRLCFKVSDEIKVERIPRDPNKSYHGFDY